MSLFIFLVIVLVIGLVIYHFLSMSLVDEIKNKFKNDEEHMNNKNLVNKKEVELYHTLYENDLSSAINFLILNDYNLESYFPSVSNEDYKEYELLWDLEEEREYAISARQDLEEKIRENDYIEMFLKGKLNEIYKDTRKEILDYSDDTISSYHFQNYFEENVPIECPFSFEYILNVTSYK